MNLVSPPPPHYQSVCHSFNQISQVSVKMGRAENKILFLSSAPVGGVRVTPGEGGDGRLCQVEGILTIMTCMNERDEISIISQSVAYERSI